MSDLSRSGCFSVAKETLTKTRARACAHNLLRAALSEGLLFPQHQSNDLQHQSNDLISEGNLQEAYQILNPLHQSTQFTSYFASLEEGPTELVPIKRSYSNDSMALVEPLLGVEVDRNCWPLAHFPFLFQIIDDISRPLGTGGSCGRGSDARGSFTFFLRPFVG